ncbi:MAG: hypothetical protein LC620_05385 [Halobacteriales archaeon]|nr:hypothetical protein [Halobacteriales archaeon]
METSAPHATGALATQRRDLWWVEPAIIFAILIGFVMYATLRILEGNDLATRFFEVDNGHYHYLSPFGTPDLTPFVPAFLANLPVAGVFFTNPAFLILPIPAGFRFTCYYYRKAYYRSFVARPAACGVEAVQGVKYRGEKGLLLVQNVHRYFLYLAIAVTGFLLYDALRGIFTPHGLYFGVGNGIMLLNVGLLAGYTFGCHSLRHLVGGKLDCFSCDALSQTRYTWWQYVTRLNQHHMWWAMASLFSVALTDVYIRWVGMHNVTTVLGLPA